VNLADVIEGLVEDRGLDREKVISIVCEGVLAAYTKKFPTLNLGVHYNHRANKPEVFANKTVVSTVSDEDHEISLRKAKFIQSDIALGDVMAVPLEAIVGRVEVLVAKQIISQKISELEYEAVAKEFKSKEGQVVMGTVHKQERAGYVIKIAEAMGILPVANGIPGEILRVGSVIRVLLKEVLLIPRGDYQLVLDRASAEFARRLIELEIPEVFEGVVEIKKIVRVAGYKTKIIVSSNSKDIDPVGTCVGVGGVRIKPILRELGGEKIDLIEWSDSREELIKNSLKPAEIDKVELVSENEAVVWLADDQRSLAIGKMGKNIALASRLLGVGIKLQEAREERGARASYSDSARDDE
jgi:N utilization substance protein A